MATQASAPPHGAGADANRALWVCDTCRLRKKGCDKQLPKCGYCAKRNLFCVYHDVPPSDKTDSSDPRASLLSGESSGRNTSSSPSASASASASSAARTDTQQSSIYEMLSVGGGGSTHLEELLNREVTRVFQTGRLSLLDIAQRFFKGFHKWLPVVSPGRFHQVAAQATASSGSNGAGAGAGAGTPSTPPADFSLLVLAMCLVTLPPAPEDASPDHSQQGVQPESLYLTVKVLFAQTQAVMCASTVLVQTGLIIAAYEYACQKLNAAYISIGTCVRTAHALALDKTGVGSGGADVQQMEPAQRLRLREDWNVWWGVVILERYDKHACMTWTSRRLQFCTNARA